MSAIGALRHWASKQAGRPSARKIQRLLDKNACSSGYGSASANGFAAAALDAGAGSSSDLQRLALDTQHYTFSHRPSQRRLSDGVIRSLFEEIGREFARFYSTCRTTMCRIARISPVSVINCTLVIRRMVSAT